MKVEDVLAEVLLRLGEMDKYDITNLPDNDEKITLLVKCVNMIVSEIASDYVHMEYSEDIVTDDGIIPYDQLKKRLINIKRVTKNGTKIGAKLHPEHILCDARGSLNVCYYYMPSEVKIGDKIELSPRITTMLIANGVLGEYCLLVGRYEDAALYDKRYREMVKEASRVTKEIVLKHGWWN